MSYHFEIPHPEHSESNMDENLPDYHPLTTEELTHLLNLARDSEDVQVNVLIRLEQAIVGNTYPNSSDDRSWCIRSCMLASLFQHCDWGGTPELVAAIKTVLG